MTLTFKDIILIHTWFKLRCANRWFAINDGAWRKGRKVL